MLSHPWQCVFELLFRYVTCTFLGLVHPGTKLLERPADIIGQGTTHTSVRWLANHPALWVDPIQPLQCDSCTDL